MQFRNAHINDLPFIVEVYNSTIPSRMVTADTEPVTTAHKRSWFLSHNPDKRPIWIVEVNEQPVGWVSFSNFYGRPAYQGTAEISIYIHPDQRGKKYGQSILAHAIRQCPALGIHTLLGFIFSHNLPSLQLFLKTGFTSWGELPGVAVIDGQSLSLSILGLKIA